MIYSTQTQTATAQDLPGAARTTHSHSNEPHVRAPGPTSDIALIQYAPPAPRNHTPRPLALSAPSH